MRFYKFRLHFLSILLFWPSVTDCLAQQINGADSTIITSRSINAEIGIGGGSIGAPVTSALISYQVNSNIYSARYTSAFERLESLAFYSHAHPLEKAFEFGFLYAHEVRLRKNVSAFIGEGISYIKGVKRNLFINSAGFVFGEIKNYSAINFRSAGAMLDSGLPLNLGKYFALELKAIGNLNVYKSFAAGLLTLKIKIPIKKTIR